MDEIDRQLFSSTDPRFGRLRRRFDDARFLVLIVEACPSRLDSKYREDINAVQIIDSHPKLASMLQEAFDTKSTKKIRDFPPLRAPSKLTVADNSVAVQESVTRQAWSTPYIGDYHKILNFNLTQKELRRNPGDAYDNYVAIIQSSGTGKSRMVHEHARICFTIPFNIREPAEGETWPPSDEAVYNHLLPRRDVDILSLIKYYIAFFVCVFERVRQTLEYHGASLKKDTYEEVAEVWREYLDSNHGSHREKMYREACEAAVKLSTEWQSTDLPLPNSSDDTSPIIARVRLAITSLLQAIRDLVEDQQTIPVLILMTYFDEAHTLTDKPNKTHSKSPFTAFTAAFDFFSEHHVLALFMSTNSNLAKFSPPGDMHTSGRVVHADKLQAPITELPFDCLSADQPFLRSGEKKLEHVSQIGFFAKFGRPLWMSRAQGPGLIEFAQAKLLKVQPHMIRDVLIEFGAVKNRNGVLAILGSRLLLDFEPRRQKARQAENELVAGHMRLAYSVPTSREYMRSGYSSEPILAEAAARTLFQLNELNKELGQGPMPIDRLLHDFVDHSLYEKGPRGELVGRLLLIKAFDRTREKEHAAAPVPPKQGPNGGPPLYGKAVLLTNFIRELFGANAEIVLKSRPDNVPGGKTFEDAFKTARVRFTHFAKAGDDTAISTAACFAAAVRGMAWQCRENQGIIDCVVPVILEDDFLGEPIMTAILIQLKDRAREASVVETVIDAAELNFFPDPSNEQDLRPYITLFMDLGVQPTIPSEYTRPKQVELGAPSNVKKPETFRAIPATPAKVSTNKPPAKASKRLQNLKPVHPRYAIRATGCSPAVYGVVENKNMYANLLGSRDFLREHPHANARSLSAILRMKPFWTMGLDSYDWTDDARLRGEKRKAQVSEPAEGVTVGAAATAQAAASASATRGDTSDVDMENADANADPFM